MFTLSPTTAIESRSSGQSSKDLTGPRAGQGSIPCFKVLTLRSCCKSVILRVVFYCVARKQVKNIALLDILLVCLVILLRQLLKLSKLAACCVHLPARLQGLKVELWNRLASMLILLDIAAKDFFFHSFLALVYFSVDNIHFILGVLFT